jgi:hypothetical protein
MEAPTVANTLLTIDMITQEAVMIFKNSNAFLKSVPTGYESMYGQTGAKIGATARIRMPLDYVVSDGPALSAQDTAEQYITMTLSTQRHVDLTFSSAEQVLKVDDYARRYLLPAMNNLSGNVAAAVMAGSEGGVCNIVSNLSGTTLINPTLDTVLAGRAKLVNNSPPMMDWKFVNDPVTMSRLTSSLTGLLNPATSISQQYRTGAVYNAAGFDWMEDQTTIKHTNGTFSAGTVSTGGQTGSTILTNAITGTLNVGDIITIASVNEVNRVTKQSLQTVKQFVVTAAVATAGTSISIYPALTPGSSTYNAATGDGAVQYQTVDVSPAASAAITLVLGASTVYRKNIQFAPEMITMATADLPKPPMTMCARKVYSGISLRTLQAYVPGTDQTVTRTDVLFGYKYVRPEWGVIVADAV